MRLSHLLPITLFATLLFGLSACTQTTVVLLDNPSGEIGGVDISNEAGTQSIDESNNAVTLRGLSSVPSKPAPLDFTAITEWFQRVFDSRPEAQEEFTLYFEHGTVHLAETSRSTLDAIALSVQGHPGADADVYGHTDSSDSEERNDFVARARAEVVRQYLVAVGMDTDRIAIDALGEHRLKVPTPDDVKEPLNRRVEIVIR
jgi:outer membrane protein OmpA-like peptidoglycan-associated protein